MHAPSLISLLFCISLLFTTVTSLCTVQGDCIHADPALQWLSTKLSTNAVISCRGSQLQLYNQGRYWGEQCGKNATVAIFPITRDDVSLAVRASGLTPLGRDLSFVSGGHGQSNASSTTGFIIDLSWMNRTEILHKVTLNDTPVDTAISYQGGANWRQVYDVTNGTGYMLVGARDDSVGVGGFSTGGGIGYLAGAYGYAVDRLRALEVVIMSGEIVLATKTNRYSDLFWALQGGNGQFGVVTNFWQEAVPEPAQTEIGIWVIANASLDQAYANMEEWFECNKDPFSTIYYAVGYLPAEVTSGPLGVHTTIVGYRFSNPFDPKQLSFRATFASVLAGLNFAYSSELSMPIAEASQLLTPYFPYDYRRGFWGTQTTKVTATYLKTMSQRLSKYVTDLLACDDSPYSATWVLQYMSPGMNGHVPPCNDATAWPHAVAAHQTLFSPAWTLAANDDVAYSAMEEMNNITYSHQALLDPLFLADYPNYMSPFVSGHRLFGDNVARLIKIKEKYDPSCRLHQGRVFATSACEIGGWANLYPG